MLKLTYFAAPGRAWITRTCFAIAGTPFEDETFPYSEFKDLKTSGRLPLGQVPVLTLPSGQVVTQSAAIGRYAAKQAGLYPTDDLQALLVDEITEVAGEVLSKCPQNPDAEEKKRLREEWAATGLQNYLGFFSRKVEANGGAFVVGTALSLADLSLYSTLNMIKSGDFDFVSPTHVTEHAILGPYLTGLEANPILAPYIVVKA